MLLLMRRDLSMPLVLDQERREARTGRRGSAPTMKDLGHEIGIGQEDERGGGDAPRSSSAVSRSVDVVRTYLLVGY